MDFLDSFSKYHIFIIVSGMCLALLSLIDKTLAVGVIFIVFLACVALFFLNKLKDKEATKFLSTLFLIVFLIHAAAVIFMYYAHFQPFSEGRGDFNEYHSVAKQVSERVHAGNFSLKEFSEFPNLVNYYPVIVGYVYTLTVPAMLMGQLINDWFLSKFIFLREFAFKRRFNCFINYGRAVVDHKSNQRVFLEKFFNFLYYFDWSDSFPFLYGLCPRFKFYGLLVSFSKPSVSINENPPIKENPPINENPPIKENPPSSPSQPSVSIIDPPS